MQKPYDESLPSGAVNLHDALEFRSIERVNDGLPPRHFQLGLPVRVGGGYR